MSGHSVSHRGDHFHEPGDNVVSNSSSENCEPEIGGLLNPGHNCWRIEQAERVSFLVDADAYFKAFTEAALQAHHSIFIIGWDIDSRVRLDRYIQGASGPVDLGEFLDLLARRRRTLHIRILSWDFSVIFAFEREHFPVFKLGLGTHRRVHFRLDSVHAPMASHHQKIVVIDDRVAFVGGLDLTVRRWDTRRHAPQDPGRVDPTGKHYGPFHDVQVMLDAQGAQALGELSRIRWQEATGEHLQPPRPSAVDPWPVSCNPDLKHVELGIARTQWVFRTRCVISEVRQLYLDTIACANRWLYIENQYFTSREIGDALLSRISRPDGPEIVIVLPYATSGWMQENTMGVLRAALIRHVEAHDKFHKLHIYYPHIDGLGDDFVKVHSKLMIADDRVVHAGSSNLSNRSMGLDTECDIAIDAHGRADVAAAIATFRNGLIAEHLGASVEQVSEFVARTGSLNAAIVTLATGSHALKPLPNTFSGPVDALLPNARLADSNHPIEAHELIHEFVPEEIQERGHQRLISVALLAMTLVALAAAWHWMPLRRSLDVGHLVAAARTVPRNPLAPILILSVYAISGLVMFPITLLIVATAISFSAPENFLYAFSGSLLSSVVSYMLGRSLGRRSVERLAGSRLARLSQRLARRGLSTIITVRLIPIAPHALINIVAGAMRVRMRDLLLGTAIGMLPGIVALTLFTESLTAAIQRPGATAYLPLISIAGMVIAAAYAVGRWLKRAPVQDVRKHE
ncbi:MAG: VTT domain-containing protein [Acidiferrobacteraceae bacterium]